MTPGLVSVVMPVYNGAAYLRQSVESVLAQTYPHVELVAVDDGSTDDSAEILARYGERVRVHCQENCGSVGLVRNAGIERAQGEFVAFLDQDDWWRPEKIARQVELFEDERVGLVHTAVAYYDQTSKDFVGPQNPAARPETMVGECFERLLLGNPICNSSVMVRKSVLDKVGLCDPQIQGNTCQDYDLWLRIARDATLGFVEDPLTVFRMHLGQGHKDRRAMLTEESRVLLRIRPSSEWRRSRSGRRRMSELYDELATAHFDHAEGLAARKAFARAAWYDPRPHRLVRLATSCLPYPLATFTRRSVWRLRRGLGQKKQFLLDTRNP